MALADDGLVLPMGVWTFVAAQAALVAFVFLLGRLSVGRKVAAGETAGPAPSFVLPGEDEISEVRAQPRTETATPPLEVDQRPRTDADQAFLAPANNYSIVAITLPTSDLGRELAQDTYDHLQGLGFDVVTPRVKGGYVFVLVGAAPTAGELEDLERLIQRTRGPGGEGLPYATAYRVNIDDYL